MRKRKNSRITPSFWFEQLGMTMILTKRRNCTRSRFEREDGVSCGDVKFEMPVAETCTCSPNIHSERFGVAGKCEEPQSDYSVK